MDGQKKEKVTAERSNAPCYKQGIFDAINELAEEDGSNIIAIQEIMKEVSVTLHFDLSSE